MATIGNLVANLSLDSASFTKNMGKAERSLKSGTTRMNRALIAIDRQFRRVGKSVKRFAKSMVGFRGAAVLAAGAAGLGLLVKKSLDTADTIAKTADAIGITTDALQEYRFALDISGVAMAQTDKGLKKFVRNMGELERSSSETQTALKDLDPALLKNLRSLNSVEDQLALGFRALASYEDQTKRAAVAQSLFGRSGVDMTVAVKKGIVAFEGLLQKARGLGLVIKEDLLRNAENAKDQLNILARVIGVNVTNAILKAAPQIAEMAQRFADAIPKILEATAAFLEWVGVLEKSRVQKLSEDIAGLTVRIKQLNEELETPLGRRTEGPGAELLERLIDERDVLLAKVRVLETPPTTRGGATTETPDAGGLVPRAKDLDAAAKAQTKALEAQVATVMRLEQARKQLGATARQNLDTIFTTIATNEERYQAELDFLAQTRDGLLKTRQLTIENEAILERGAEAAKKRFEDAVAMAEQAKAAMDPMVRAAEEMAWTFDNLLDSAIQGNIKSWGDLRRVAVDALQDIINQTIRLLAIKGGATGKESIGGLISGLIVSGIGLLSGGGGAAAQVAGDLAGGVALASPFAHGGPITAGQLALVGERGRELFVPDVPGRIIPNDELGGLGGGRQSTVIVNQQITTPDSNSFRANSRQISRLAKQQFSFA